MKRLALALLALGLSVPVYAVPTLQLDIVGTHHYDTITETIIADSNPFSLRALISAPDAASLSRNYYISGAIVPAPSSAFGSFTFDGEGFHAGNMVEGIPPVDDAIKDLASHDVFPTFYFEHEFQISTATPQVAAYNTQDDTSASGYLYYVDFAVNVGLLSASSSVHFDLYTYDYEGNVLKIDNFAPFSHDAQSGTHGVIVGGGGNTQVPDGGTTLGLLGMALIGLGALRRPFQAALAR